MINEYTMAFLIILFSIIITITILEIISRFIPIIIVEYSNHSKKFIIKSHAIKFMNKLQVKEIPFKSFNLNEE